MPALDAYHQHGLLSVSKTRQEAINKLVADWKQLTKSQEDTLILCGTNVDATTINRLCQAKRLEAGELGKTKIKVGTEFFHAGDRVLFTKNASELAVRNGNIGTVVSINRLREQITVDLGNGASVTVPLKDYDHVKLGYCATSHKGQGKTVETCFALLGGNMQDREISYVQASRARGDTRLYADSEHGELKDLARQMATSHQKVLATTDIDRKEARRQGV